MSVEETESRSSGSDGVKLALMGVPGMPLTCACSLSLLPSTLSSSSDLCVTSADPSLGSDSPAGTAAAAATATAWSPPTPPSPPPPDSLASEQRWAGPRQFPVEGGGETMSWADCCFKLLIRNAVSLVTYDLNN